MKARVISTLGAAVLSVAAVGNFAAVPTTHAEGPDIAGASGLVAAVVQIDHSLNGVYVLDSNFTNVQALNNVLNNSPILSNNDINNIQVLSYNDFLNNNTVTVQNVLTDFLNNNNVAIGQIVGVSLLDGGQILVFI